MKLPAVAKSVLICLADISSEDGVCWPGVATLCERTCYGERAVQNALRWLAAVGLIEVRPRHKTSSLYVLRPEAYKPGIHLFKLATQRSSEEPEESADKAPASAEPCSPEYGSVLPRTSFSFAPHHVPPNRNRTVIEPIPPLPPKGAVGPAAVVQTSKRKRTVVETIEQWLERCKAAGQRPIPEGHAALVYAETIGMPDDIVKLHWSEFKRRHRRNGRRQADWGLKFLNSIEGNWYGLWYIGDAGRCLLTTKGKQAMMAAGGRDAAE